MNKLEKKYEVIKEFRNHITCWVVVNGKKLYKESLNKADVRGKV